MPTVDSVTATFACRSAALRLSASCHFRMSNSGPVETVHTICRPSEQPFATLRTPFQRPTYPHSGVPTSPSLTLGSSSYPQQAPQTSSSGKALLCHTCYESRKQYPPIAHYRLYNLGSCLFASASAYDKVWSSPFPSAIRGIGGSWSGESVVACHSQTCSVSTSMQP